MRRVRSDVDVRLLRLSSLQGVLVITPLLLGGLLRPECKWKRYVFDSTECVVDQHSKCARHAMHMHRATTKTLN